MGKTKGLLALVLVACLALAACGGAPAPEESSSAPAIVAPSSTAPSSLPPEEEAPAPPTIKMLARSHENGSIIEVPQIETEAGSAVAADINRRILEFVDGYEEYLEAREDFAVCEIKCYPFLTEQRVEIVLTRAFYPSYGSYGDVASFVYDWQNDAEVQMDEALAAAGADLAQMEAAFREGGYIGGQTEIRSIAPAGFCTALGLRVFFEVTAGRAGGDDWKYLYSYDEETGEFYMYGNIILFEPDEPEQMAWPLFYQKITLPQLAAEWTATAWGSEDGAARLHLQDGQARMEVFTGEAPASYTGSYSRYAMVLTLRLEGWPLAQVHEDATMLYIPTQEGQGTYLFEPTELA